MSDFHPRQTPGSRLREIFYFWVILTH